MCKFKNKNTQIACIIVIIIAFVLLMTVLAYLKVGSMFKYSHNLLKIKCGSSNYQPNTFLSNASHVSRAKRIINGMESGQHTWPWMVSLKYFDKHYCAGALIHPLYVLTASHCIDDKIVNDLSVVIGAHDVDSSSEDQYYKVSSLILHEEYDHGNLLNDIGLIKLTEEVRESDNVAFMCIPDSPIPDEELYNKRILTAGWGEITNKKKEGGNKNAKLHEATLKILEKGKCKHLLMKSVKNSVCKSNEEKKIVYDEDKAYCAEDYNTQNASSNICDGDSGGPLLTKIKNEWYGIAISSFTLVNCQGICNHLEPSYHTKLSAHLEWIFAHTRDDD